MSNGYLARRLKSIGYALKGIGTLLSTQAHARLHLAATLLVVAAGLFVRLRVWEWIAILLCIGMVWLAEALNTALEFLADEVSLDHRERIGKAKDVAAGGVLITAIVALVVGALVFWHHFR